MISSAQVLRDLQTHFNPSKLFAPWLANEQSRIARENANQRRRRGHAKKGEQVKLGHGGTLDPLATGVLITGIGKGTKSLQNFLLCTKTYEAVILFGTSTDSYDRVGKILSKAPYEHVTKEMLEEAMVQFRGKFKQLPPLFSALKMNGKPLYEYARAGIEPPREIEKRDVEVLELEIVEWMEGGTHSHEAPTEEAGPAEINVANKVWSQAGVLPGGKGAKVQKSVRKESPVKDELLIEGKPSIEEESPVKEGVSAEEGTSAKEEPLVEFEDKKRKMDERQDDLVLERPVSKRKATMESQEAIMSGGLAPPSEDIPVTEDVTTEEPKSKGPPAAKIRMTVTSGFYVRSLCHDLGAAVGSAALMAELERTVQADFQVGKNCLEYSDLEKGEEVWGPKVAAWLTEWEQKAEAEPEVES